MHPPTSSDAHSSRVLWLLSALLLIGSAWSWTHEGDLLGEAQYDIREPWPQHEMRVDQLRLSATRGTTPNPAASRSVETYLEPLELSLGDVVADIGCGSGYTVPVLLNRVGPTGTVYAIEFFDGALRYLHARAEALSWDNVIVHRDTVDDLNLPEHTLDHGFMINVMHAFSTDDPARMTDAGMRFVASVFSATKPGGRILIIDSDGTETTRGRAMPLALLRSVYGGVGFEELSTDDIGHGGNPYSIVFERPHE